MRVGASRLTCPLEFNPSTTDVAAGMACSTCNAQHFYNSAASSVNHLSGKSPYFAYLWKSAFCETLLCCRLTQSSLIPASIALSNPNIMRESMASRGCVIFVGNLPGDVREREVEDLFVKVRHALLRNVIKDGCSARYGFYIHLFC